MGKKFKNRPRASGSASHPNPADVPPGGVASGQSGSILRPDKSSRRRWWDKFKLGSRPSSPSQVVDSSRDTPDRSTTLSTSQPLQIADSTAVIAQPQCPYSETSTSQVQDLAQSDVHSEVPGPDLVWAETMKIAQEELTKNHLPLDLTHLTSRSAGENIKAVIEALDTLQKDEKKKRWRYQWRGKEVVFVEALGKILKTVEPYSAAMNTALKPQVMAAVWAGVWVTMRVRINLLFQLTELRLILW